MQHKDQTLRLLQGNEACAEGAIAAGATFYAGYPITPSTEIMEYSARRLPEVGGSFIQMEDEIGSMAAVIGASVGGAKAFTATSGPGFSLKQENIGYAVMAEIPCVIVNVQRLGPSTGVATAPAQGDVMQARWGTHGDHPIIVYSPSSVKECYDLTVKAFNISEVLRQPVIVLLDEIVGHMRESISLPVSGGPQVANRTVPDDSQPYKPYDESRDVSPLAPFGEGYNYNITGLFHDEQGFPMSDSEKVKKQLDRLHRKVANCPDVIVTEEFGLEDADLVVLCYGCTARPVQEAVQAARAEGLRVGMLRLVTLWPFPAEKVLNAALKAGKVLVPEMNMGQLVGEVEKTVKGRADVIAYNRYDGELITPAEVLEQIKGVI
ncbi:MAG: 2-oxoacid:acceptor oxidoreductase subunit alpha [Bacillota bacterium]|nr:2-oxoacid:acceptor oxidoreductase subunit alpha [Bacillota bacterium]MDW7682712.1 2-oxoacid:acceptor oxidoreductase subunit alpha [Bacillota bacterium]